MDILKISQRVDAAFGVAFLIAAVYFVHGASYWWALSMVFSAVVSFLSVKYTPAKWLLKRMLLARMK